MKHFPTHRKNAMTLWKLLLAVSVLLANVSQAQTNVASNSSTEQTKSANMNNPAGSATPVANTTATVISNPASANSIKALMELAHTKELLGSVQTQIDAMMIKVMHEASKDSQLTKQKQAALDAFRGKIIAIEKEELSWESMEAMMVQIYQRTLTQDDIDGITVFYKSPAGQAFIKKMPAMMQDTMQIMQVKMQAMASKIKQAQVELDQQMKQSDAAK